MDKKYDFRKTEKELQDLWEEEGIYRYQNGRDRKVFSIDTPPPTVSGKLHIGHVFSYTQAEMIARYKRMRGYDVFYPFGFDDNGLPTERLVEKDSGIRAADMPGSLFREKCMETIVAYEADFKSMWQRLGLSVDWSLQYQTVSDDTRRISQRAFLELVKQKRAYRKESPVLWCTQCRTSIAQAELEMKEQESVFNYLAFEAEGETLLIATTRPELLYGCVCVFVNPEDERYRHLAGKKARVPLYGFEIPVLTDEQASMDKGTGAVMCATYGDTADTAWCEKHGLPYKRVICPDGTIDREVPLIGGMKIRQAREAILQKLEKDGALVRREEMTHMVAVHERCGTDVEIIPSSQWYIDVLSEKERFLEAADEIRWHPAHMKSRYISWVENLKWDWCISRQRYFGVPFPVWYCKSCKEPVFAEEDRLPVNPAEEGPGKACRCGCREFIPETAVFDTWATSSVSPLINARYKEADDRSGEILPMGMRHQAHENIRTWAFYTIVRSLYHTGNIPWKDIMISGFVLAKPGEKISKSKSNGGLSPIELIETHSADAIRYWAAGAKLGTDTFFSEEDLRPSKRFLNKLYNASRFALMHLEDYRPGEGTEPVLLPVDLWILERVKETVTDAEALLEEYETGQARKIIDELFWEDFCDYYIEIVKERLYQPEKHGAGERAGAQYALYHTLLGILKLYAIYVPYITDYIYRSYFREFEKEVSLHCLLWTAEKPDSQLLAFGSHLKEVIAGVRKEKTERQESMKEPIPQLVITSPGKLMKYYKKSGKDIMACTSAEKIIFRN